MIEAEVGDAFITQRLNADSQLRFLTEGRIFSDLVLGAGLPAVVFTTVADVDVLSASGDRIMAEATYLVKAIVDGPSYSPAQSIADRIDAVLHHSSGPVSRGEVFSCIRRDIVRFTETVDGEQIRHLGANYRLQIQASL